jgi:hypothetical protein
MRKEKALVGLLHDLVELLAQESDRNPEFGARLEQLLMAIPERRNAKPRKTKQRKTEPRKTKREGHEALPDIHAEWHARGEADFLLWLRDQTIPTIRAVIRAQDFDPTRRTAKWKDAEKLAGFVADSLRSRLSRGSAFTSTPPSGRPGE